MHGETEHARVVLPRGGRGEGMTVPPEGNVRVRKAVLYTIIGLANLLCMLTLLETYLG